MIEWFSACEKSRCEIRAEFCEPTVNPLLIVDPLSCSLAVYVDTRREETEVSLPLA